MPNKVDLKIKEMSGSNLGVFQPPSSTISVPQRIEIQTLTTLYTVRQHKAVIPYLSAPHCQGLD